MEYILGPKDPTRCVFCEAVAAEGERLRQLRVLVVTKHTAILLNTYPFNAGHLLIVPHEHVDDIAKLDAAQSAEFWEMTRESCVRLRKAVGALGLNVGLNLGTVAGAGIRDHVHFHVVPRWQGDTNFMPVIFDVHVMPQYLDETWARLYPYFADLAPT